MKPLHALSLGVALAVGIFEPSRRKTSAQQINRRVARLLRYQWDAGWTRFAIHGPTRCVGRNAARRQWSIPC